MTSAFRTVTLVATLAAAGCAKRPPAVVSVPPPPLPTAEERLTTEIQTAIASAGVARGLWGILIHSLDRGEPLFALNADRLLVPGSVAKLVSVATAADAVGWDYQFTTTMGVSGHVEIAPGDADASGTLHGDILVTGSGDPTIGGRGGDDLAPFVDAIRAAGIRRVEGRIIADDDSVEEPRPALAWAWDDLGYVSGVLFGALNLRENRMVVTVEPGAAAGTPAIVSPEAFARQRPLDNRIVTGPAGGTGLLWPEQRPGEPALTLAGSIPAGSAATRMSVSVGNPTQWFADVLRERLIDGGIPVLGGAHDIDSLAAPLDRSAFRKVYEHRSGPLRDVVQPLMKDSVNLYAEAVMRLNAAPGVFPTNDAALDGLRVRLSRWGIPPDGQQLVDGSGLSRRNVITPGALVAVLARMHEAGGQSPWMASLPVAGVDGTLRTRMSGSPAQGNVRAKTGTMSNVRALAGYATTRDGERLAFAIIVNNFEGPGAAANNALDRVAIALASFARDAPLASR